MLQRTRIFSADYFVVTKRRRRLREWSWEIQRRLGQRVTAIVSFYRPSNGEPLMAALAFALHILGAVVWVGGMFAIYVCLRPALVTHEPPQRLRLMRATFQKFFP